MGEYMSYRGDRIKIGTCESLYYLRFDQRRLVSYCGDADVNRHLYEYRFRFPFPDEDHIEPGNFDDHDRSVEIPGYEPESEFAELLEAPPVPPIRVVRQRLVEVDDHAELQVIVRDSAGEHDFQCQLFRLNVYEAGRAAEAFLNAYSERERRFDLLMAQRIMAGYATNPEWAAA